MNNAPKAHSLTHVETGATQHLFKELHNPDDTSGLFHPEKVRGKG